MKKILAFAAMAIVMASCNSKYEKTETGLAYKIFKGDKSEKLQPGQIVKINGMVRLSPKDSVLFTTYGRMPVYITVDTSAKKSHDFNEVIRLVGVGDSLVVVQQVDTLVKLGLAQYNEILKKGQQLTTTLKIIQVMKNQEDQAADQQKELEKYKAREVADLDAYLKKKNIKAEKTENGVFVAVANAGDTAKASAGQEVSVKYTGSLLETGKAFDSNIDTAFGHAEPFKMIIGAGRTIRGWEEGLQKFGKGGKGTLYIPSLMGYGPPGQGGTIPPYSALKFDVEVVDINVNPVQPQQDPKQMDMETLQRMLQEQQQKQGGQGQPQGQGQQQQPPAKQ